MKKKSRFIVILAMALVLPVTSMMIIIMAGDGMQCYLKQTGRSV